MNKLGVLLRANLINSFGINKIKEGSRNKGKDFLVGITYALSISLIGVLVAIYSVGMARVLEGLGMMDLLLQSSIFISSLIALFTSIYKAQGILFGGKDFESISALPLKQSTIVSSKLIELLLYNYLFTALIIVPSSIVYYIYVDISATFFIYMIVAFLFIPVIPIILASVIAFILSFIATRSQHKNIFVIVLSLAFIVVFMALSAKMNDVISYVVENSSSITEAISKIYPPAFYYCDALGNLNLISLIKMILWAVVPFVIFIFAFAKSYRYINIKIRENHKNLNFELTDSKVSSKVDAIFKKEFRRYLSSPIYVLNTSLGLLLIIIAAVVSIIMGSDTLIATLTKSSEADLLAMKKTIEGILQYVPLIIISFGVGLSCTTGSAISLEGKNFWILKTSPIKAIDVLKGKIYVNLVLSLSTIIIATLLFDISFNLTFINMIWTILIPSLLAVFVAVSGIIINLYFPNLTWTNETKVVKQSISSMLSIFLGLILVGIIVGLSYVGIQYLKITNITIYLVAITILFLILDAVSIMLLNKKGTKLFDNMSC